MEMDIVFRKSELQDIDQMVRIADEGKALLKSKGINQWQRAGFTNCGELVLLSGDEVGDLRYGYELKREGTV